MSSPCVTAACAPWRAALSASTRQRSQWYGGGSHGVRGVGGDPTPLQGVRGARSGGDRTGVRGGDAGVPTTMTGVPFVTLLGVPTSSAAGPSHQSSKSDGCERRAQAQCVCVDSCLVAISVCTATHSQHSIKGQTSATTTPAKDFE